MRALLLAWVFSLVAIAGGAAYLWAYEPPALEAREAERMTITQVEKAPVLSSGAMTFDASQPENPDEDCLSSC